MNVQGTETIQLPVLGMTCASCQHHVETALGAAAGVESARVDLMGNRASVVFDPGRTTPENLIEVIRSAGYDAVLPRPGVAEGPGGDEIGAEAAHKAWASLAAGAIAMVLAMPLDSEMGPLDHVLMSRTPWLYELPAALLRWFLLGLSTVVVTWAGRAIYLNAWRAMRHGSTNMNTLVSLGTGVAFFWSVYATLQPAAGRKV
jgi:P-type Cu+ transporter